MVAYSTHMFYIEIAWAIACDYMIAATYAATWMHFLILLLLHLKVDKSSANFHKGSTQPVDDYSLDILILVSSNLWSIVFFIGKDHAFTPLSFSKFQLFKS